MLCTSHELEEKKKTYLDYEQVKKGKKDKRKKEILVHLYSPFRGSLLDAQNMISLHMFPYFQVGLEGEYLGLDKISLANSSLWTQGTALPVNHSLIWYKVRGCGNKSCH